MFIVGAFIFLLAYYFFVLRKYNTLGFRLFSLCFFVSVAMLYWWGCDWQEMKKAGHDGILTQAIVQRKSLDGVNNVLDVAFRDATGNTVQRTEHGGISDEEFAELVVNDPAPIRYSLSSDTFFLEKSFQRQSQDQIWFLLFPGFFLLLGSLCWIFLRRYRILPHEGTTYEYMLDEKGMVVLDDAKNDTTKNLRKGYLLLKFFQLLGKG